MEIQYTLCGTTYIQYGNVSNHEEHSLTGEEKENVGVLIAAKRKLEKTSFPASIVARRGKNFPVSGGKFLFSVGISVPIRSGRTNIFDIVCESFPTEFVSFPRISRPGPGRRDRQPTWRTIPLVPGMSKKPALGKKSSF